MPIIRTIFRPWEEIEVSAEEAASMAGMGLLADDVLGEPDVVDVAPAEPDPEPSPKPRRGRTTSATTAPAEEVNTDGSSEEGGTEEGNTEAEG